MIAGLNLGRQPDWYRTSKRPAPAGCACTRAAHPRRAGARPRSPWRHDLPWLVRFALRHLVHTADWSSCPSCRHRAPRSHGVSARTGSRAAALPRRAGHPALRRSGALPPGLDRRPEADTRAVMTAESTCRPRSADRRGRRPALPGSTAAEARDQQTAGARQEAAGRLCAARADLPGLRQRHRRMRAAPDPRILTGWSGASPHVLRFPPRAFLRFPVCPPGSPPSPPSSGFPSSGVLRFVPFGRRPGSGSPFGVPPGSLPLGKPHDSAAAGRFRRRWSRAARAKVTSPAATLPFLDLAVIRPAPQAGSGRAQ